MKGDDCYYIDIILVELPCKRAGSELIVLIDFPIKFVYQWSQSKSAIRVICYIDIDIDIDKRDICM